LVKVGFRKGNETYMSELNSFKALIVRNKENNFTVTVENLTADDLPQRAVTVQVEYSTINYKDGLAIKGQGGITKTWPHIPGIDLAGTVVASETQDFSPGDRVVMTSLKASDSEWGGYSQIARLDAEWLTKLPDNVSNRQAMAVGTAGFSAMMALEALEEQGLKPENEGEVLVTGAAGGVGSIAVALFAATGYRVAASTGRPENKQYLKDLGATSIVTREEMEAPIKGPLGSMRWAGAVDNVGGVILSNLLAGLNSGATCACVGLAASAKFEANVIPFLLRGVKMVGVDSGNYSMAKRYSVWQRLSQQLPMDKLEAITTEASLDDLPILSDNILSGKIKGRVVINVNS
jgi:acrylyl-CoA reductase (NADPH)